MTRGAHYFAQLFSAGPMPAGQSVIAHNEGSVVGQGCDDQFEFEFALDLLLDEFDNLHQQGRKVSRPSVLTRRQIFAPARLKLSPLG